MQVPFVDLQAQHRPIQHELNQVFQRVIEQAHFVLGEEVDRFEAEYAAYCGTHFAVGVDSGLSALKLALQAYGIGPGDEVIVPANTFIATAAAVTFVGAQPVLVDIDSRTYNLDIGQLEAAITPRVKAIIPVHLYGSPADMDGVLAVANRHGLLVIEDACQAHGARYNGRRVGSFGHAAAFSFYPAKNLGAGGDAGIVVTDDAQIAERIRALRNCGQVEKYRHIMAPHNHRLDTLQAAILRVKLPLLDGWNAARQENAAMYNELLADKGVIIPGIEPGIEPVWHLYVIRTEDRDGLKDHLARHGISTGIHYPIPVHRQPYYQDLGYRQGDFPVTERYAEQILSLPMYPELSPDAIRYVVETVGAFVSVQPLAVDVSLDRTA